MIEFRFKITEFKNIKTLNKYYTPAGKQWKADSFTGEFWIKITKAENTQLFNDSLLMFLRLNDAEHTLQIMDCDTRITHTTSGKERPKLF